ncbi:MAG: TonB-dependent receptor, partial [Gemmatimonadota bacterium]
MTTAEPPLLRPGWRFTLAWPVLFAMALVIVPPAAQAQETGTLRGAVRSESGMILRDAVVEVIHAGWRGGATADAEGRYRVEGVPAGRSLVHVRYIGHAPLELEVVVAPDREIVLDVSLAVRPIALAPVRARSSEIAGLDSIPAPASELSIVRARAIEASPGLAELGVADAIRGVPGQEPPDPGSVLYVRGAAADLKLVYLDGAPVYAPFPLGGLIEPFAPEMLHQADIYLGGAPARYDGGLSYVMDLRTRAGRGTGVRTSGSVDLLAARMMAEVGLGESVSVIASGRGIHPLASGAIFDDPLPYRYREGLLRTDLRLGEAGRLTATGFSNRESVRMGAAAQGDSLIRWGNTAGSVRFAGTFGTTSAEITAALGEYSAQLPLSGTRPLVADGTARRSRLSVDFARPLDLGLQLHYGVSLDRQRYVATARTAASGQVTGEVQASGDVAGAYAEGSGQIGDRVRVRGGLRVDQFSGRGLTAAPRLAATWLVTDRAALTLAAGRYHQFLRPPDEILLSAPESVDAGHPSLTVGRASHFTVGLDQELGDSIRFGIEGYFKDFTDVPGAVNSAANASGVDFWLRRSAGRVTGWVGYSLAWVWSESQGETGNDFAGRHLLSAGLGAPVGERTRLDFRFAYGAGLPYAAIPLGTSDFATRAEYPGLTSMTAAERGGTETAPLLHTPEEPYLRLDVSISQLWKVQRGARAFEISPYLRVLNGLGRRDALFYFFDGSAEDGPRAIGSLPIIPVVGVEWT